MRINQTLATLWLCAGALLAQRGPGAETAPPKAEQETAIPSENSSVTEHDLSLNGKSLHHKATTGTLLINDDDDKPYGSIFYAAYTLTGISDLRTRPVTFLYNGGPGMEFIGYFPTYAAIADHFEKVQHKGKDLPAFLNEVRAFALGQSGGGHSSRMFSCEAQAA